ncbi:MAG: type II secretion system F family protein [Nitrospiria bacterium]
MPDYQYRAVNPQGCVSSGAITAGSEDRLESKLASLGLTLIEVSKKKKIKSYEFGSGKVSRKEIINFSIYLHTTLSAGIPLITALQGFHDQLNKSHLKTILNTITLHIQDGEPFSDTLRKYPKIFPELYVNLITAGEASGNIEETLANLVTYLEGQEKIISDTKQATIYPLVILSLVAALILFILSFVLPRFMPLFESTGIELPTSAKFLITLSDFFQNGWPYMMTGIVGFYISFHLLKKSEKVATFSDRHILKLPLFGTLIMKISMSQFAYNLSTLLNSGIEIDRAFTIAKNVVKNRFIFKSIHTAQMQITGGTSITDAMKRSHIFPPLVIQMLAVGEETGSMPYTLSKVKEYYDREVTAAIKKTFSILEPAIILVLGLVVGGIAVTIFLTLYKVILAVGQV